MLQSFSRNDIQVIVVTDGERILGLGDQGSGWGFRLANSRCIPPAAAFIRIDAAMMLDVGTNNAKHLEDPLYMGWRHPRINDDQYMEFMDMFVDAVKRRWPHVLLHLKILPRRMWPPA
jgi:malate dehydrogenase (oxaloacetate-decarboxylating)